MGATGRTGDGGGEGQKALRVDGAGAFGAGHYDALRVITKPLLSQYLTLLGTSKGLSISIRCNPLLFQTLKAISLAMSVSVFLLCPRRHHVYILTYTM